MLIRCFKRFRIWSNFIPTCFGGDHHRNMMYVGIVIIIYKFTVQNWGTRKLVEYTRRKLGSFTTNFNAKITSCWQTGICLNRLAVPCGFDSASHSIPQSTLTLLPTLSSKSSEQWTFYPATPSISLRIDSRGEQLPPLRTCSKLPLSSTHIWDTSSYPPRQSLHFLSYLCAKTYISRSQHIFCGRHLLCP